MSISPVGTSSRAREKALLPESLVRVLIAMEARRCSTGAPTLRWYAPAAAAAAQMNAVLSVPPEPLGRRLGLVEWRCAASRGAGGVSGCVHTGEWAASTSESWVTTVRTVSAKVMPADGIWVGIGEEVADLADHADRHPQAAGQHDPEPCRPAVGGGGGSGASSGSGTRWVGGSGASRARSRNCIDIRTLASPSAIVWCIFSMRAPRPPFEPVDDDELPQRPGAVEGVGGDQGGEIAELAHRSGLRAGRVGGGGSRGRTLGRRPTVGGVRLTGVGCTR